ncbi:MAG: ATP-dependent RecD-like DNA helicase [Clostridia bacterium]|nr:ATP-dependent RecD-like DNA helicase [Clostridia bacterium]
MNNKVYDFKGEVDEIVYYNEENGYCIFDMLLEDGNMMTCVGTIYAVYLGEKIKVTGTFTEHKIYGKQFKVESYEKEDIKSKDAIIKYLSSGIFKGIGEKTAEKIVEKFKEDTFDVIENNYEKLVGVRGVTYEKAEAIHNEFLLRNNMRNFIIEAQRYEISINMATKIYEKYKDRAMQIIESNPYTLIDEIENVNFKYADKLALKGNIKFDNIFRIEEGIRYTLKNASNNGHVYLPKKELINNAKIILEINDDEKIEKGIDELIKEKKVFSISQSKDEENIYLKKFYYAEKYVSDKISNMLLLDDYEDLGESTTITATKMQKKTYEKKQKELVKKEREINRILKELDLNLSDEQYEAVLNSLASEVSIITGGPGTGKTTIINVIVKYYELNRKRVTLVAPTGRAANRMSDATHMDASTIHRLLEVQPVSIENEHQCFARNEDNPIDTDVIIVDEMSMVDILLFNSFLKAVELGTKLILVGDEKQLPSVGPGNVLKDLIGSKRIKTCFLTQVFRQAEESNIIKNAHLIRNSKRPILNDNKKDFFFMKSRTDKDGEKIIIDLITKRLPKFLHCSMDEIQILCPSKKGLCGTQSLNEKLQSILNPNDILFKNEGEVKYGTKVFKVGDKVMQIKNNYDIEWQKIGILGVAGEKGRGVFNGDVGKIISIDNLRDEIKIKFDDEKEAVYETNMLDELDLAYAITIHKSQGSEYKAVIIPCIDVPELLANRNLLYTGITRAKNLIVLVGNENMVYHMTDNDTDEKRYSSLKEQLIFKIDQGE